MSSIDQQFIEYVVKSLVGNPDAVKVERRIDEKGVLLELTVDPEDLGRVIGKRGATAQSLRTLLRALGTKNDARYNLKIVDNGPPREDRQPYSPQPARDNDYPADDHGQSQQDDTTPPTVDDEEEEVKTAPSEPVEEIAEEPNEDTKEPDHSEMVSKTRKELAEFDDLDV